MKTRTERHPLYGDIPLITHTVVGTDGREYPWLEYDPHYKPALPKGAVQGNVAEQIYCRGHYAPKYFYLDEPRDCVQCGERFTFLATEQKFWYESLKFNFNWGYPFRRGFFDVSRSDFEQIAFAMRVKLPKPKPGP